MLCIIGVICLIIVALEDRTPPAHAEPPTKVLDKPEAEDDTALLTPVGIPTGDGGVDSQVPTIYPNVPKLLVVHLPLTIYEYAYQLPIFLTPTSTHTPTPTSTTNHTPTPTSTTNHTPTPTPTHSSSSAIVVDHHNTDIFDIPDVWIAEAKEFVVHYAHTSHGGQVLSGLQWLESRDPKYNVDIEASGTVVLPDDTTALRIYDGNNYPGNTYITPDMYWESAAGIDHTHSVADTRLFNFSLWTWCGQASSYSVPQIQSYLDVMAGFETEYPGMRYIYYTGHSDGTAPGSTLWRNNDMIRQYVQDNQKVLFDFNDMEVYAPDGSGPYYNNSDGYCEWCVQWCSDHPSAFECQDLPSCDHTHGLFCTLKGQAFWALMARLAGWDGTP